MKGLTLEEYEAAMRRGVEHARAYARGERELHVLLDPDAELTIAEELVESRRSPKRSQHRSSDAPDSNRRDGKE